MLGLFKKKVHLNSDVIDKAAYLLRQQVMLCRFEPRFIAAREEDIVRGYFVGFFDCCLQRRGLAPPDDETFFLLMVRGHEALLATYLNDIRAYTFTSLRRQDNAQFHKGMRIGGEECLGALHSDRSPLAFPLYLHEGLGPLAN